jgi:hypothetical protein
MNNHSMIGTRSGRSAFEVAAGSRAQLALQSAWMRTLRFQNSGFMHLHRSADLA